MRGGAGPSPHWVMTNDGDRDGFEDKNGRYFKLIWRRSDKGDRVWLDGMPAVAGVQAAAPAGEEQLDVSLYEGDLRYNYKINWLAKNLYWIYYYNYPLPTTGWYKDLEQKREVLGLEPIDMRVVEERGARRRKREWKEEMEEKDKNEEEEEEERRRFLQQQREEEAAVVAAAAAPTPLAMAKKRIGEETWATMSLEAKKRELAAEVERLA